MDRRNFLKISVASCVIHASWLQSGTALSDDITTNPKTFFFQSQEASIMTAIYDHGWELSDEFLSDLKFCMPSRSGFYEFGSIGDKNGPLSFQGEYANMLFVVIRASATSQEIKSAQSLCMKARGNNVITVLMTDTPHDQSPMPKEMLHATVNRVIRLPDLDGRKPYEAAYKDLLLCLGDMFTASTAYGLVNIDPVDLRDLLSGAMDGQFVRECASGHDRAQVAANAVVRQIKDKARNIFVTIMIREDQSETFRVAEFRQIMEILQPGPEMANSRYGIFINPEMKDSLTISCVALA